MFLFRFRRLQVGWSRFLDILRGLFNLNLSFLLSIGVKFLVLFFIVIRRFRIVVSPLSIVLFLNLFLLNNFMFQFRKDHFQYLFIGSTDLNHLFLIILPIKIKFSF